MNCYNYGRLIVCAAVKIGDEIHLCVRHADIKNRPFDGSGDGFVDAGNGRA